MNKKSGTLSMTILCSSVILAKHLIIVPEYMVKHVGNSAWIDILAKSVLAIFIFGIMLLLYKPFGCTDFNQICKNTFGTVPGTIINLIFTFAFVIYNAGLLRLLSEALSTIMATDAPIEFFSFFVLLAVFFGAYHGIQSASNLSIVIFPLIVVTLIVVCFLLFPLYRSDNISPILGLGSKKLFEGIFTKHFCYTEILLLFFYAGKCKSYKELKNVGILTVGVSSLFAVAFTFSYCMSVPYPASANFFLPLYQMTRMLHAGIFLQRVEPLAVFIWTSFIICSISICVVLCSKLLSSNNQSSERGYVPIVTVVIFLLSMMTKSEAQSYRYYEKAINYGFILYPVLPFLLLAAANICERSKKRP